MPCAEISCPFRASNRTKLFIDFAQSNKRKKFISVFKKACPVEYEALIKSIFHWVDLPKFLSVKN
jgi:hypothetical protein